MRLPNGYGGIRKLSGNRRRPYQVVVTAGWENVNGKAKQVQKTIGYYPTKAEALNALAEFNVNPIDIDKTKFTFAEVWEKFLDTQQEKSKSKQRSLHSIYLRSEPLYNKVLSRITLTELQRVIDTLNSHAYKSQGIVVYRALYDYAFRRGYVKQNIALLLENTAKKPKPEVNIFTKEEYLAMPRHYDLFFYTGMRANEMLSVTKEDIDFERGIIHCKGSKTDSATRFIPIHDNIKELVYQTQDKLWYYDSTYNVLYKSVKATSKRHTPHDMRKTFATVCYLSGIDDVLTKRLMGHSVTDITHSTYIKNDDVELLRSAMSKLDYNVL